MPELALTQRQLRRFAHAIRRADKKKEKRMKATRERNMRPFMRPFRSIPNLPPSLEIKVGNDLQTYEPEAVRLAREDMEFQQDFMDFYGDMDESNFDWFPNINFRLNDEL